MQYYEITDKMHENEHVLIHYKNSLQEVQRYVD